MTCCPAGTSTWLSYSPCRASSPGWRLWCGCLLPARPTLPLLATSRLSVAAEIQTAVLKIRPVSVRVRLGARLPDDEHVVLVPRIYAGQAAPRRASSSARRNHRRSASALSAPARSPPDRSWSSSNRSRRVCLGDTLVRRPLAGFGFWLHRPRPPLARVGLTRARQASGIRRSGPPSPALPLEPLTNGTVVPTGPQLTYPGQSRGLSYAANLASPSDKRR
jgi:ribosomal protein L32